MTTATTLAPTCEARTGFAPGEWEPLPLWCNATVGLTTWTDRTGQTHRACRHHLAVLRYRYPEPPPDAFCVICKRDVSDGLYGLFRTATGVAPVCDDCVAKGDES